MRKMEAAKIYKIFHDAPVYDGDPLKNICKPEEVKKMPFIFDGDDAYLLARQYDTLNAYRFRTIKMGNSILPRCDKKPYLIKMWSSQESFDKLKKNYGY